jgi:hypothetical protein
LFYFNLYDVFFLGLILLCYFIFCDKSLSPIIFYYLYLFNGIRGLGSDQLGHGSLENRLSVPQLLETLLPENGGGRIVVVSAANDRTCVVSDVGDLYTWGATAEKGKHFSNTYMSCSSPVINGQHCFRVIILFSCN